MDQLLNFNEGISILVPSRDSRIGRPTLRVAPIGARSVVRGKERLLQAWLAPSGLKSGALAELETIGWKVDLAESVSNLVLSLIVESVEHAKRLLVASIKTAYELEPDGHITCFADLQTLEKFFPRAREHSEHAATSLGQSGLSAGVEIAPDSEKSKQDVEHKALKLEIGTSIAFDHRSKIVHGEVLAVHEEHCIVQVTNHSSIPDGAYKVKISQIRPLET